MGRLISYVFIFVCGFAACALILKQSNPGFSVARPGAGGATARGRENISLALDSKTAKHSAGTAAGSLAGTPLVAADTKELQFVFSKDFVQRDKRYSALYPKRFEFPVSKMIVSDAVAF